MIIKLIMKLNILKKKATWHCWLLKTFREKNKEYFFCYKLRCLNSFSLSINHWVSQKKRNDLTLISSMRNYKIPYGVCTFDKSGKLKRILEKPSYDHFVNTGLYLLAKVLKLIPSMQNLICLS